VLLSVHALPGYRSSSGHVQLHSSRLGHPSAANDRQCAWENKLMRRSLSLLPMTFPGPNLTDLASSRTGNSVLSG
jgi:hypothetical protein